jgi:hypothetical protein
MKQAESKKLGANTISIYGNRKKDSYSAISQVDLSGCSPLDGKGHLRNKDVRCRWWIDESPPGSSLKWRTDRGFSVVFRFKRQQHK